MMKKNYLYILLSLFLLVGCNDNVLDRPQLNSATDVPVNWEKEDFVRNFSYGFYKNYFQGYNVGWTQDYAPLRGYLFADDFSTIGKQMLFENTVPATRGSLAPVDNTTAPVPPEWLRVYNGPTWYFGWVRKANLFAERIENYSKNTLDDASYRHWLGIARFFRGLEYARLVGTFGDVPYYDKVLDETEVDEMYKDRTPRAGVMDKVYEDFKYALENVREFDVDQTTVNKYVVAGFVARWMLFEGTWQKYHNNDTERAKKFLTFGMEAAEKVINSGKFAIVSDFRTLFGSMSLAGNKDCVFYRHYDAAEKVTHCIASYCCGYETQNSTANLDLVKAFICNDGKVWQNSDVANANLFTLADLAKTRDPRFEATFWDKPMGNAASLVMTWKFVDRVGPTYEGKTAPAEYNSSTNPNDYPVMRYAEVLLNWIEAKAELATLGGVAVTQADMDKSINAIRNRPIDKVAQDKGVQKTAPLQLASLPNDPARDATVPALLWEIRRERRMEFVYEHSRLNDLRRWKKINYMNATQNPDLLKSVWIDFPNQMPSYLSDARKDVLKVYKEDGTPVVYDGTNAAQMVGYYHIYNATDRDAFTDRVYLAPVGKAQIDEYAEKGYKLSQTIGW